MENWEKLTKEIMRLIEANITATIDPEDNDGEPVLEIESSLEKSIGEIISSELESAKQEERERIEKEIKPLLVKMVSAIHRYPKESEADLVNFIGNEYIASLHQNNNEQGGK